MPSKRLLIWTAVLLLMALSWALPASGALNPYVIQILMYVGINMILTLSLNLINGYMGEFSVGHAGFMAIGAYVAAILSVWCVPKALGPWLFPFILMGGGLAAAAAGLVVAIPSFRTRGDYLAIVTLAFNMIVKSILENLNVVGGPRGFKDISLLTNFPWVVFWVIATFYLLRNLVYSNFGRGITAIREDEVAANLTSVDTRRLKVYAFCIGAFFAGVAGGLFAHLLQFINPRSFSILKSTDMLVMVYLGGMGSLTGSLLGATIFTLVLEFLRPLGLWRWVIGPLLLVFLMIFRPEGIMGFKDPRWLQPEEISNQGSTVSGRQ
jgi:branched-chain amino acid transport system permease protein|uniref:Branched-chain amino acid ABC transporter permease n=1 Tax=Desulfobacca acetoxidans TaxID=60893 RepID=A0A7V6A1U4_9BACT